MLPRRLAEWIVTELPDTVPAATLILGPARGRLYASEVVRVLHEGFKAPPPGAASQQEQSGGQQQEQQEQQGQRPGQQRQPDMLIDLISDEESEGDFQREDQPVQKRARR